ncbi:MAG: TonB-dependent receptor [Chitinophagaceae bacterium]|nr:TonB-dependent receptor [Chitinophagaceae bacterium]
MTGKSALIIFLLFAGEHLHSQTIISGLVKNSNNEPLSGAGISLENKYDGTTSAADGTFSFNSSDTGQQKIIITILGYKKFAVEVLLRSKPISISAVLKEAITEMDGVTVSAGSFEASDKKRSSLLKPLDILTTAGQQADIVSALKTLPGAQQVGETEGLFIRGGTGNETKIFIDGMMVTKPFFSSVPDIAQRGRFSPLLFKGTNFSSGGYSAQLGQGLSSALTLETHDLPARSETNLIVSSPQLTLTRQQLNKRKNASACVTVNYNNLQPYFNIIPQRVNYTKSPEIINGELSGRLKTKDGMLKYYGYLNYNSIGFDKPNIEGKNLRDYFGATNKHVFSILTYSGNLNADWKLNAGTGFSYNKDNISMHVKSGENELGYFLPRITNYTTQAKIAVTRNLPGLNKVLLGTEYQQVIDKIDAKDSIPFIVRKDNYAAVFTETDLYVTTHLVARLGIRYEYSSLLGQGKFSPRISMAYKWGGGQVSMAFGNFYQKPDADLLFRTPGLQFTKATHLLLSYQRIADRQTVRIELFYKKYNQLVTFPSFNLFKASNDGKGYAKGIELFWRDKKTFKNFNYWIAYSLLNTRRQYLDYPTKVQPSFAASHTLNIVMKQWMEKIASMFSITYTYASGRPYYNPNLPKQDFMKDRTIAYHNVGFQINYLTTIGKANAVLIFNTNNVFGNNQVFGYHFSASKDVNGLYRNEAIIPMARRFYFIGIYLSIGTDRRKEIIDN